MSIRYLQIAALLAACWLNFGSAGEVTWKAQTRPLPAGVTVFITGNQPQLGNWNPCAVAMTRIAEDSWSISLSFADDTALEYKFTLGGWDSEALSADSLVPPNSRLTVSGDTVVTVKITLWKDQQPAPSPQATITGTVVVHPRMEGEGILPRDVLVWLPPGYAEESSRRYPVLYLHDGQNVFNPRTSFTGYDWRVDEVADSLIRAGQMEPLIMVAIYNTGDRTAEYGEGPRSRAYMNFVAGKLKPFIDQKYRTRPEARYNATMGSSMGGLISFLLVWEHPEAFSQGACLSPAFVYGGHDEVLRIETLAAPPNTRFYLDCGTAGTDEILLPGYRLMVDLLHRKGYHHGDNLYSEVIQQAPHNERAWSARVWKPLLFMFPAGGEKRFHQPGATQQN